MPSLQESSSVSSSGPSPYLMSQYGSEYGTALGLNNTNYQNILGQYGQSVGNIGQGVAGVAQGYGNLSQQVQGTIQGIGQSQSQAIKDVYAQQAGGLTQQLINSGLGNSTVMGSMQRGVTLDSQKAQIALANQIAQLTAGYQSQLGSAGLNAQMQGVGLQAQAGNTLLGALASYKTPYPSWPPNQSAGTSTSKGQSVNGPMVSGPGRMGGMLGGAPAAQTDANPYFSSLAGDPNAAANGPWGNTYTGDGGDTTDLGGGNDGMAGWGYDQSQLLGGQVGGQDEAPGGVLSDPYGGADLSGGGGQLASMGGYGGLDLSGGDWGG